MGFDFSSFFETDEEKKRKKREALLNKSVGMPIIGTSIEQQKDVAPIKIDWGSFTMPVEEPVEDKKRERPVDYKLKAGVGYMPPNKYFKKKPDTVLKSVGKSTLRTGKDVLINFPALVVSSAAKEVVDKASMLEKLFNPVARAKKTAFQREALKQLKAKGIAITNEVIKETDPDKNFISEFSDWVNKTVDMNETGKVFANEFGSLLPNVLMMGGVINSVAKTLPMLFKKTAPKVAEKIVERIAAPIGMAVYGAVPGIAERDIKKTIIGAGSGGLMGLFTNFTKIIKPRYLRMLAGALGFRGIDAMSEAVETGELPKEVFSDRGISSLIMGGAMEYFGKQSGMLKSSKRNAVIKKLVEKIPANKEKEFSELIDKVAKKEISEKGIIKELNEMAVDKPTEELITLRGKEMSEPKKGMLIEEPVKETIKTEPTFEQNGVKYTKIHNDISEAHIAVDKNNVGWITNLFTKEGQRSKGGATNLMQEGIKKLWDKGVSEIRVVPEGEIGRSLNKKLGFKGDGQTMRLYKPKITRTTPVEGEKGYEELVVKAPKEIPVKEKSFDVALRKTSSGKPLGYEIVLNTGDVLTKPKSKESGDSPYFETYKDAEAYGRRILTEPVKGIETPTDALTKLREVIKKSPTEREHLEAAYSKERAKRFREVEKIFDSVGGEKGFHMAKGKLKGVLGSKKSKIAFSEVASKLPQKTKDSLMDMITQHSYLTAAEKISAGNELEGIYRGEIPTPKGLVYLEEVFGKNLIKDVLAKRRMGLKFVDFATELVNIPKALLATADMSGFLRQGAILVASHPVLSAKAMKDTFKFAFSPKAFVQYFKELHKHKYYSLMRKFKIAITNPTTGGLGAREDIFISRMLQKIPGLGHIVRFAERSYVGFLNKLRVDTFTLYADELMSKGFKPTKDAKMFRAAADVVNTFSGRGTLGRLSDSAKSLNTLFFSPRLISARFHALNPRWYAKMPKPIRIRALKDFAKFVAVGTTTLGLIKLMGGDDIEVETDPRSSDFGKIRIGNTRWDIWGGFQQWARTFAQIAVGETKSTVTGEIRALDKSKYPFTTRKDVGQRFIENKLGPVPALIKELISGAKTFSGEDMTIKNTLWEKLIPMYVQDIADAYKEDGIGLAVRAGVPAFFGVGVQTWGPRGKTKADKIESLRKTQKGLTRRMNKLRREGKLTFKLKEKYDEKYDKIEQQIAKYSSGA